MSRETGNNTFLVHVFVVDELAEQPQDCELPPEPATATDGTATDGRT